MGLLIDLINHGKLKIPMKALYVSAGVFTSTAVSIMGLLFVFTARERVVQRIEKTSVLQGIKSILNNKPLLILTITDFLTAFGMNSGVNYYYINVLGFASMTTIVGIPEEMRNETIDYGEWKNGYRTEGMTGVAKDLARKLVGTLGASIKAYILSKIGYVEGAGYGNQSEKTEYLLFMMCTLLPTVTSVFGLVPKFFYDLSVEKKERMYRELAERRQSIIDQMNQVDSVESEN